MSIKSKNLIYTYKVRCLTEGIDYEIDSPMNTIPTCCPTQGLNHIIDSNNIQIINKNIDEYVNLSRVVIQEETEDATQGFFRVQHYKFACPSNCTTTFDMSFKYPVNISSVKLICDPENNGDSIDSIGIINSPIGMITSNVDIGDKEIKVNSTVQQYMSIGTDLMLTDFTNTEELGEVLTLYTDRVVVENPATRNWTAGSTYVKMEVHNIVNLDLHSSVPLLELGLSRIGGSIIKPGVIVRINYTNLSLDKDKHFCFILEYTY
jgi:hypothetical protein